MANVYYWHMDTNGLTTASSSVSKNQSSSQSSSSSTASSSIYASSSEVANTQELVYATQSQVDYSSAADFEPPPPDALDSYLYYLETTEFTEPPPGYEESSTTGEYDERVDEALEGSTTQTETSTDYVGDVDANGDGKVTDEEILNYYLYGGDAPSPNEFKELSEANPNAAYYMEYLLGVDVNGNGTYDGPQPSGHGSQALTKTPPPNPQIK